jgi:uncharacterized protein
LTRGMLATTELRRAIDEGDATRAQKFLRDDRSLTTALIEAPDIEPTSPLTYIGMARFCGYADHDCTGELARVLIDAGADKDDETKNGSPLVCAASHGDTAVVRVLLDAGADLELSDPDAPSDTALRLAAAFGHPEIVDMLIAAGARINSIIEAAVNERLAIIDQLLAAGTLIDADVGGFPAIHWAAEQGRQRAVAHLQANGARLHQHPTRTEQLNHRGQNKRALVGQT